MRWSFFTFALALGAHTWLWLALTDHWPVGGWIGYVVCLLGCLLGGYRIGRALMPSRRLDAPPAPETPATVPPWQWP